MVIILHDLKHNIHKVSDMNTLVDGGLEVERFLHKLHDSISVGTNPARCQKDFRSNSNTTGGALVKNDAVHESCPQKVYIMENCNLYYM